MLDFILVHRGRQHNYQTFIGLRNNGLTGEMITNLYLKSGSILKIIYRFGTPRLKKLIENRYNDSITEKEVLLVGELIGILLLFLNRFRLLSFLIKSIDKLFERFFNYFVIKIIVRKSPKSIYVFSTTINLGRLRSMGYNGKIILELSGSNPKYIMNSITNELKSNPLLEDFISEYNFDDKDAISSMNFIENCDLIVVPSNSVLRMLPIDYNLPKSSIVPYGISDHKSSFDEINKLNYLSVLFVGRGSVTKGFHYFLETSKYYRKDDIEFGVVGTLYHKYPKKLQAEYQNVTFYGKLSRSRTLELMEAYSILVLPSLFEGMSLTVIEAMSRGTVVITSINSGYEGIINNGVNGFILSELSVSSIISIIDFLSKKTSILSEISKNAYKTSLNYTWKKYGEGVAQIVEQELNQSS